MTARLFYWGMFLSRNTFINFAQFHRSYIDFICMSNPESRVSLFSYGIAKHWEMSQLKSSFHLVFFYNFLQFMILFLIQVLWHLLRQIHMVMEITSYCICTTSVFSPRPDWILLALLSKNLYYKQKWVWDTSMSSKNWVKLWKTIKTERI